MSYASIEKEALNQIKALAQAYDEGFITEKELGSEIDDIINLSIVRIIYNLFGWKKISFC